MEPTSRHGTILARPATTRRAKQNELRIKIKLAVSIEIGEELAPVRGPSTKRRWIARMIGTYLRYLANYSAFVAHLSRSAARFSNFWERP